MPQFIKWNRNAQRASHYPMSSRVKCVLLLAVVCVMSVAGWRVSASRAANATGGESHEGLARILNPDGTLQARARGSFETSGYRMELTAMGAPRFVPLASPACGTPDWDAQFSLPNGTTGSVQAV